MAVVIFTDMITECSVAYDIHIIAKNQVKTALIALN